MKIPPSRTIADILESPHYVPWCCPGCGNRYIMQFDRETRMYRQWIEHKETCPKYIPDPLTPGEAHVMEKCDDATDHS